MFKPSSLYDTTYKMLIKLGSCCCLVASIQETPTQGYPDCICSHQTTTPTNTGLSRLFMQSSNNSHQHRAVQTYKQPSNNYHQHRTVQTVYAAIKQQLPPTQGCPDCICSHQTTPTNTGLSRLYMQSSNNNSHQHWAVQTVYAVIKQLPPTQGCPDCICSHQINSQHRAVQTVYTAIIQLLPTQGCPDYMQPSNNNFHILLALYRLYNTKTIT